MKIEDVLYSEVVDYINKLSDEEFEDLDCFLDITRKLNKNNLDEKIVLAIAKDVEKFILG